MLVDLSRLEGIPSPAVHERFFAIRSWAVAAGGTLRLALLVRPEWIDPNHFGVTVAANHGLTALPFIERAAALAWLASVGPPG